MTNYINSDRNIGITMKTKNIWTPVVLPSVSSWPLKELKELLLVTKCCLKVVIMGVFWGFRLCGGGIHSAAFIENHCCIFMSASYAISSTFQLICIFIWRTMKETAPQKPRN